MPSLEEVKREVDALEARLERIGRNATYHDLRMMEATANKLMGIIRRMSGSEEVDVAIRKIQDLITIIRMAQVTIMAFNAASGPIGWGFAIVGLVATAITIGDVMMELGSA